MRFSKVLLINPFIYRSYMGPIRPSAGLGYLAEYLSANNIQYEVLDMNLGYGLRYLWKKIEQQKPDLIGLTVWTYRYKNTYALIELIKKRYPDLSVAAGGPHISSLRIEAFKECKGIDFGITLEGEKTIIELCQGKPFHEIKGLIYHKDNELVYTGDREFIIDLDSIPFPKYEKFELERYFLKEILIISSRGCPHACIYCPVNLAIGKRLRIRSAKNVVDEITYWYNRDYRRFNFGDDNFTFFKERVYEICDEIERRGLKDLDLRCGNGVRADKVDRQLLKRMKEVGFSYIGLGVEAGNNRMLKILKKGESIEEIEGVIGDACDLGYDVTLFFLAGSPGETWADIKDSARLAEKYPVMDARFYNIVPYPSTELFEWLTEKSLLLYKPEEYLNSASAFDCMPIFETPELSAEERIKVLKWLKKVEKRILRKGLARKLRKYGFISLLVSNIASTTAARYLIRHSRLVRQLIEKIRYNLNRSAGA
ncbi:MAG: hypothetical protein COS99_02075 [Candidatus Omnitrophica bacterium CG07_land_8_20_14_0_80_42_15]|uniref:Uncharacterized protein n=1 Tax=Candidatus Aquitaenariimonas noxiae TaxID=1974741 RepID=A0A2J0L6B8_9BACT|nr:MAG: hypothetical protein COS99_02075 [Candidatus Omnitrophica bacterium CG07_land_8_20_14_0_80_42_15]